MSGAVTGWRAWDILHIGYEQRILSRDAHVYARNSARTPVSVRGRRSHVARMRGRYAYDGTHANCVDREPTSVVDSRDIHSGCGNARTTGIGPLSVADDCSVGQCRGGAANAHRSHRAAARPDR
jgi:hypothetical protein